jgi:rubredoxin
MAQSKEEFELTTTKWKKVHLYQCPCGYKYEPEKGDPEAGWDPGTPFDSLPDQCTCPRCQRAKMHFREKEFSELVSTA